MPFLRYANARSVNHHLERGGWDQVRVASGRSRLDRNLVDQASKILKEDFDPSKHLLTHCTIVASVDTYPVPGMKTGSGTFEGKKVVRKTSSYRIKPECDLFINNNKDSWARPVLLASYPTFIGGHSFLEHVQIPELSKGRILDAVARDIGDSVYIDILVANDRKHKELIKDIESGKLATLSMGCSIDGSTCTKCGHWAADETEMCSHVRFEKGNTFYDEQGRKHCVAELCGDESLEGGGVQFIEASWVEIPAFKGAVARNIVTLDKNDKGKTARRIHDVISLPAREIPSDAYLKAASLGRPTQSFVVADEMDMGEDVPPEEPAEEPKEPASPFQDLEDEVTNSILDNVRKRLRDKVSPPAKSIPESSASPNGTLVKQASSRMYTAALREIVRTSKQDVEVIDRVATLNQELGIFVPRSVYRVALQIEATSLSGGLDSFLLKCGKLLGRKPSSAEARTLIRLASLLSAHQSASSREK